jgi:hypothetical protein
MMMHWIERRFSIGPYYSFNVVVTFGTLAAATAASAMAPSGTSLNVGSGTIREVEAPPAVRRFFSVLQFHATAGCLIGLRRFSTQYIYVWIVQFTAFLFTLRRKNIFPHGILMGTYGFMLITGFVVATYEDLSHGQFLVHNILGNFAAFNRLGLRLDKYLVWLIATAGLYAYRFAPQYVDPVLPWLYVASVGVVLTLFQNLKPDPPSVAEAEKTAKDGKPGQAESSVTAASTELSSSTASPDDTASESDEAKNK